MAWVDDQIYAAGGEHIPSTWNAFARQTGVTAVLHLAPNRALRFHGSPPQVFLWLDVADETEVDIDERRLAACFLLDCLAEGRRVLLHSSLGRHRTRWAYVAYCISAGRSVGVALRQAAERPWLSPYHTDTAAWEEFAEAIHLDLVDGSLAPRRGGKL